MDDADELSDFAKHILKQICSQKWVHNRCLQVRIVLCVYDRVMRLGITQWARKLKEVLAKKTREIK